MGKIVFLSPPLLFCHICCFLGRGLGQSWEAGGLLFPQCRQLHRELGITRQKTKHVSVLRSEKRSGFLVARVHSFGV